MQEKGLEPSWYCYHTDLNRARLPIPPFSHVGGGRWIRTTEVCDGRFTVCSLWPLGNPSMIKRTACDKDLIVSHEIRLYIKSQ